MKYIDDKTEHLFLDAISDMEKRTEEYAKKSNSNAYSIKMQREKAVTFRNFYDEVSVVLDNISVELGAEVVRLKAEKVKLRKEINGGYSPKQFLNREEREAYRAYYNNKRKLERPDLY